MYNFIKHGNNYSKTSEKLWQYYKDESALTAAGASANLHAADNIASFKFKQKKAGAAGDNWYKKCWNSCVIKIFK